MENIYLDNKKVFDLITENEGHQKKVNKILDNMQSLEKELNKVMLLKQKVRDKMQKIVAKELGKQDEFIVIASVVKEGKKVKVNRIDLIEEYKAQLRKKYEQNTVPATQENDTAGTPPKEVDTAGRA